MHLTFAPAAHLRLRIERLRDAGLSAAPPAGMPRAGRVVVLMKERQIVEIVSCSKCRSVWLDHGEMDKIIEGGLTEAPFVAE